jgi:hypothetical protein
MTPEPDEVFLGFLPLNRRFFRNFLWMEERVFSRAEAWIDLVQTSAYEPQKKLVCGELIEVPRGGIVASERFLSIRWKWSRTKVRAFLDLLVSQNMIQPEKNHRNTVFLLCNFDKYNPQKNHPPDRRGTTGEPPGNQSKEGKEIEKREEGTAPAFPKISAGLAGIDTALRASPEFCSAWRDWRDHINEMGKPLTRQQEAAVITECARAGAHRAAEVLRYSISKGAKNPIWDAPKEKRAPANTTPQPDPAGWLDWLEEYYPEAAARRAPYDRAPDEAKKAFRLYTQSQSRKAA